MFRLLPAGEQSCRSIEGISSNVFMKGKFQNISSSVCDDRSGRLASQRVVSPWIEGGNH